MSSNKIPFRPKPEGESSLAYNRVFQIQRSDSLRDKGLSFDPEVRTAFENAMGRQSTKHAQRTTEPSPELIDKKQSDAGSAESKARQKSNDLTEISLVSKEPSKQHTRNQASIANTPYQNGVQVEEIPKVDGTEDEDTSAVSLYSRDSDSPNKNFSPLESAAVPFLQFNADKQCAHREQLVSLGGSAERVENIATIWKHVAGMEAREPRKEWSFTLQQHSGDDVELTLTCSGAHRWNVVVHSGANSRHQLHQFLNELRSSLDTCDEYVESVTFEKRSHDDSTD
ncbi:MAG: hypothetical protein KTR32_33880 [Granulosicoccus sp.]|nr:hypothetical protein [Granulosicoccus sp.]